MNRIIGAIVIIIIIVFGVIAFLYSGEPTVEITNGSIGSLNSTSVSLDYNLSLNNPYIMSIPVKNNHYVVQYQINETSFPLTSGEKTGYMLQPGKQEISVPLEVNMQSLDKRHRPILSGGPLSIIITGNVTMDFLGKSSILPYTRNLTVIIPYNNIVSTQ